MLSPAPSVAAVIVTYRREDLLRSCLEALAAQTRPVQEVVVVDNGGGAARAVTGAFGGVTLVEAPDNEGPAGGFARGMRRALAGGHDWLWLFNDDDVPHPEALATLLDAAAPLDGGRLGMVGGWGRRPGSGDPLPEGDVWRAGGRRLATAEADHPYRVDVLSFGGLLVSRRLPDAVGLPRAGYFMMYEEIEYCLRARKAGFAAWAVPRPLIARGAEGSPSRGSPPWRGYYQTRNQLVMALQQRSPAEVAGWALRQVKFVAATLLWLDRRPERLRLRLLGAWHALRGVEGRTVEPA